MDRSEYLRDVMSRAQDGGVREITRKQCIRINCILKYLEILYNSSISTRNVYYFAML